MNRITRLIALTTIMALFGSPVQGQQFDDAVVGDSAAYYDSGRASYLSAALPIGAIAVAAIIIATTNRHHHHHGNNNNGSVRRNSSSSHQ